MVRPREISTSGEVEILAPLSVGGMGEVHLARRRGAHGFEKLIALKTIRHDLVTQEEMRRMFLDEAKLLARLDHPSVAQVYDFVEQAGALYLSMEYVPGVPLSKLMQKRQAPLPPSVVARMGVEICRGLHAAHELAGFDGRPLGVVHRDVSPQNLMLTFDGRMKILDFGVAYMFEREATTTQTGLFKGKLAYISPEQITGEGANRRSDIYSLCVVLHELLTGKRLFAKGGTPLSEAIKRKNVKKPSEILPFAIPPELDEVVMKGLSLKPSARFSDTREMALALEAYLSAAGGTSLEAFAEEELKAERRAHAAWIQTAVEGPPSAPTAPAPELTRAERPVSEVSEAGLASVDIEPKRRSGTLLGLTIILAAVAAGAWLLFPKDVERSAGELAGWAQLAMAPGDPDTAEVEESRTEEDDPSLEETPEAEAEEKTVAEEGAPDTSDVPDAGLSLVVASSAAPAKSVVPPPKRKPPPPAVKPPPKKRRAVARRTPKRTTPRRRYGALSIHARPGGSILVDGKRVGGTPLRKFRVTAGKHWVALKRPGDRKARWKSTVFVREGKHVQIKLR